MKRNKMMYTDNKGYSYYKNKNHYYKNSGWLEIEITKNEYERNVKIIKEQTNDYHM